jgi:hypothetical protein
MAIHRAFAAAAALLLAAAPAAAQQTGAPAGPPAGAPSPAVASSADSYAFARRVLRHLRQAGVERPSGRVALWIGAGNGNRRLSLAETNVPQALWPGVVPLVDAFVAARTETTPLELSFYREQLPDSVGVSTLADIRSERPPRLRNMDHVAEALRRIAAVHPDFANDEHLSVKTGLRMLLDRRGRPVLVENLMQGDAQFNRYLTSLAYELRFDPARVNGEPIPVWVEGPTGFDFTIQRQPGAVVLRPPSRLTC